MNPAQHGRVDHQQRHRSERDRDCGTEEDRQYLPPRALRGCPHREGARAGSVDQQQRHGRDAGSVDRGDERHVDQRRAEARKTAHRPGQYRDTNRGDELRLRDDGGKGRAVGKVDHGTVIDGDPFHSRSPGSLRPPMARRTTPAAAINRADMARPIRILGIDPGLRRTGWGMVVIDGNRLSFVACGSLATDDKASLAVRLLAIHDGLRQVVAEHAPDEAAVEATFVNKDAAATLKLGQARGIAMLVPAIAGLPVAEYAPNLVKKTIVGAGHCEKAQIRMMIGVLLPKADPQSDDAADALAIAVTHAHHRQSAVLKVAAR